MTAKEKEIRLHTRRLERFGRVVMRPFKKLKWDMALVGVHYGNHKPQEQNYCGSAACAMGYGAMDKVFQRQGLTPRWTKLRGVNQWYLTISYRRRRYFRAFEEFLGLTSDEANAVFGGRLDTRAQVARELRRLARKRNELWFKP